MRIARPFGIPVFISPYWFVIAGLFVFIYANDLAGRPCTARSASWSPPPSSCCSTLSVLVHELSHSLVARGFGLPVRRHPALPARRVLRDRAGAAHPGREFLRLGGGPGALAGAGGRRVRLARAVPARRRPRVLLAQLCVANLLVGIFNLLPGLPLDGGRMLRAGIWKMTGRAGTATIAAAWAGRVLAVACWWLPLRALRAARAAASSVYWLWLAVIAGFMWIRRGPGDPRRPSSASGCRLRGADAGQQAPSPVPASVPLAEAIRRAEATQARALVIVDHESTADRASSTRPR